MLIKLYMQLRFTFAINFHILNIKDLGKQKYYSIAITINDQLQKILSKDMYAQYFNLAIKNTSIKHALA